MYPAGRRQSNVLQCCTTTLLNSSVVWPCGLSANKMCYSSGDPREEPHTAKTVYKHTGWPFHESNCDVFIARSSFSLQGPGFLFIRRSMPVEEELRQSHGSPATRLRVLSCQSHSLLAASLRIIRRSFSYSTLSTDSSHRSFQPWVRFSKA